MFDGLSSFFAMRGLPPHGYCLLWDPTLVWTHVAADALIGIAYFSIPFVLWRLLNARRDIEFSWMVGLFAVFIMACGLTHFVSIYVLWVPAYGLEAVVKAITAIASVGTAILLIPLLPKLVALPSPSQLRAVNEQLVAESAERERTAELLRQAQKLEALGRLTGGVAHDFNNLLQVVIGNLERVQRRLPDPEPAVSKATADALSAAERAAQLTDQLLSFARQRPIEAQQLDLGEVIEKVGPLIERAVGPGVALQIERGPSAAFVVADRTQLENALLNLAMNARDAMPGGGTLAIAVRAADEPQLIEIEVADSGTGMDADTLARATDPFFTTKAIGEGTGLGLSQVYGMLDQLGGSMRIESTLGTGTCVRLFLPRATSSSGGC